MTKVCSRRSADFSAVTWYRVPDSEFIYWDPDRNSIILAEDELENGALVRHEMLHAILRARGHPAEQFLDACASLVTCSDGVCGPWHSPPGYVILPPDSLQVDSRAELLPRAADGQQWLALEITVRNNRDRAVVVAAPGDPKTPDTFAFTITGLSGGEVAIDSSTLYFATFATKRWLYEFLVTSDLSRYHVPPGRHRVQGGYARVFAPYDTVDVSPS